MIDDAGSPFQRTIEQVQIGVRRQRRVDQDAAIVRQRTVAALRSRQ